MSRTKRGNKFIGYDYWGKRIGSSYQVIGRSGKKNTLKRERMKAKEDLIKEIEEENVQLTLKLKNLTGQL